MAVKYLILTGLVCLFFGITFALYPLVDDDHEDWEPMPKEDDWDD